MTYRVLYIEDNPDNLLLIQRAVEGRGYGFLQAEDGESGVRAALSSRPDIILLDINLPDIDGYEVVRRIRAHPALEHLPVIAITAKALPGDAERVLAAGCDVYMAKPIQVRELWAKLAALLPNEEVAG
jgi:two-component system cell cycle response regulator DivK